MLLDGKISEMRKSIRRFWIERSEREESVVQIWKLIRQHPIDIISYADDILPVPWKFFLFLENIQIFTWLRNRTHVEYMRKYLPNSSFHMKMRKNQEPARAKKKKKKEKKNEGKKLFHDNELPERARLLFVYSGLFAR